MINVQQIKSPFISSLRSYYSQGEAEELFWLVAEHITGQSRFQLKLNHSQGFSKEQEVAMGNILKELEEGKPFQYIVGEAWFYNQKYLVSEAVLIPRPETEELVDLILKENKSENLKILDIGTGSGCIPIALKTHLPAAQVFGIDISEDALKVAKANAGNLGQNVMFLRIDILNDVPVILPDDQRFDIIVSNPPYITPEEKLAMHKNVLDYEPHLALFVDQDKPLIFYEAIVNFALTNLKRAGKLYFEINKTYGKEIVHLLAEKGFKSISVRRDLSGHDRMVSATI